MSARPATQFAAAVLLACAPTLASAQVNTSGASATSVPVATTGTAHLIEWDLPATTDAQSGALVVDTRGEDHNRIWFVTRLLAQRVYRMDLPESLKRGNAQWTSWDLHPDAFAGGVRKIKTSHDRRYAFVHMSNLINVDPSPAIQQIDTQCTPSTVGCKRIVWSFPGDDLSPFVSDLAVDDYNRVFSTGFNNVAGFPGGYIQMLDPAQVTAAKPVVTRWGVLAPSLSASGGTLNGPGNCQSDPSVVCNAGIDIHPSKQNLVYFTESGGFITELNTAVNADPNNLTPRTNIRRWKLTDLDAKCALTGYCDSTTTTQPRSLKIDRSGKVWVNTGSGHLISLDPATSMMTKHQVPGDATNDLWSIAPDDDVIGYTGAGTQKVAMMFPHAKPVYVPPVQDFTGATTYPVAPLKEDEIVVTGTALGIAKIAQATTTPQRDGTYVEAFVNTAVPACSTDPVTPSFQPLGITPNHAKAQGTFFYTVGIEGDPLDGSVAKRIGFARLPIKEKIKHGRDDDDSNDGFDSTACPSFHNSEPGDSDADGVPDQFDSPSSRDSMTRGDAAALAGQRSVDYPMTASTGTLALIASVEADPTAQIAVDIYNGLGVLQATSGPMIGVAAVTLPLPSAGNYTARVRNLGLMSVTHTPTLVVRDPIQ
jgi:hypothetical protein